MRGPTSSPADTVFYCCFILIKQKVEKEEKEKEKEEEQEDEKEEEKEERSGRGRRKERITASRRGETELYFPVCFHKSAIKFSLLLKSKVKMF